MGTSISFWDGSTAYFLFSNSPFALILFALGTVLIGIGLITVIKRHEDTTFAKYQTKRTRNNKK